MKYFITILLVVLGLNAGAQIIVKAGTDGYVTINGQNYPRGYLLTQYTYKATDSLLALLYANTRTYLVPPTDNIEYRYGDTADKRAFNMLTLRAWMNANLENK